MKNYMAVALSVCSLDLLLGFIESTGHNSLMYVIMSKLHIYTVPSTKGREPVLLAADDFERIGSMPVMVNPEEDKKDSNLPLPDTSSRPSLQTLMDSKALTIAFHSVTGEAICADIFDHLVVAGYEDSTVRVWDL
jgi:hypothetical protein